MGLLLVGPASSGQEDLHALWDHWFVDYGEQRTAAVGFGQQWSAAPACTAATDPVAKGSLPTSALKRMNCLQAQKKTEEHHLLLTKR